MLSNHIVNFARPKNKKATPLRDLESLHSLKKTPKNCVFQGRLRETNKRSLKIYYLMIFIKARFTPILVIGKSLMPIPFNGTLQ